VPKASATTEASKGADGSILASLSIERGDVLPALQTIERLGIEYLAPRRAAR
jgi:hypothetical protein